jgi:hypothetical protein
VQINQAHLLKNIFSFTSSKREWLAVLCFSFFLIVPLAVVWLRPVASPLSVSITHLGYTNGFGPYALLAITNSSHSAITLDSTCLVKYSLKDGSALRRVSSIEANKFRITRLFPGQGFVQDVFVFPAGQGEWQFECHAAYSSGWLEFRRSLENRIRKFFSQVRAPFSSKAWRKFETDWLACPP